MSSRANLSLFRQLEDGAVQCGLAEGRSSRFLPESLVHEKITKDSITAALPLLQRIYSHWSPANSLPDKIHSQAKKVFAVLALIGQESTSSDLVYGDNITDQDLPLAPKPGESSVLISVKPEGEAPKEFPSFKSWDERGVRDFLEKQWQVLAPVLDAAGKDLKLDPSCPLPIEKSILKVTGNGVYVYQAWFHPAHQLWSSENQTASSVAIKEVQSENVFGRERSNLKRIEALGHPNLIKLLASCERGSFRCFIFPWAEGGSLWDLWKREDQSPRTQDSVMWLFEQVLGLIDAIRVLHKENIRHGDIKPQNILHFTTAVEGASRRGTLVLADVGVSRFHEQATGLRHVATDTREVTFVYEAPEAEYNRQNNQPRSRRYDMWSAGCVLLECTVWLLFGLGAVETFRSRRSSVTKEDPKTPPGSFFQQNKRGRFKINAMVVKAMELLRRDPRCEEGTALADLLDLVEDRLLQTVAEKRAEAPELHEKLQAIVSTARENASYMWKGATTPPEIPKFFVKSARPAVKSNKSRKYSDSSQVSSGSLASRASKSSGASGSASSWDPRSSGGNLESVDSFQSRSGV